MVYVRGRDRITRLHDLNDDGEADFYENFYSDENEIGASYHAFIYDLQTDREGNFYFSQSGYKSPLTGAVVRIDKHGRNPIFIGTDLRNPNGIGVGGPNDWVTVLRQPQRQGGLQRVRARLEGSDLRLREAAQRADARGVAGARR